MRTCNLCINPTFRSQSVDVLQGRGLSMFRSDSDLRIFSYDEDDSSLDSQSDSPLDSPPDSPTTNIRKLLAEFVPEISQSHSNHYTSISILSELLNS